MAFIKIGDAQPIIHIIDISDQIADNLLEKAAKENEEEENNKKSSENTLKDNSVS